MKSDTKTKDSSKHLTKLVSDNSTILLVEDESPVRKFSAYALSNKGYKVIDAGSGEEALDIINECGKEISLVVTDVVMPGIAGPLLVAELRKNYPNIKVIFISGYAEETFDEVYKADGEFYFLSKPFTLEQLAIKVKEVLGTR